MNFYTREESDRLFDLIMEQRQKKWEFFNPGKKMPQREKEKATTLAGEMMALVEGKYQQLLEGRKP